MIRLLFLFSFGVFIMTCATPEEEISPIVCDVIPIVQVLSITNTPCGERNGRIELIGSGGTGTLTYSIDGFNYQTTPIFENLASGRYQVEVRDEKDCTSTTFATLASGISFENTVRELIEATCAISSCHVTGEQAPDFTRKENIFSAAARIRTQLQSESMPPSDSGQEALLEEETQQVICWINEGTPDN